MERSEDFIRFISEHSHLLEHLEEHASPLYDLIHPIYIVLKYLIGNNVDIKIKLRDDVFQEGYNYLYLYIEELDNLLNKYYNNDIHALLFDQEVVYYYERLKDLDELLDSKNAEVFNLTNKYEKLVGKTYFMAQADKEEVESLLNKVYDEIEELPIQDEYMLYASYLKLDII